MSGRPIGFSRFLRVPRPLAQKIAALVARGRFVEADSLSARALRRRGDDPHVLEQYAFSAHNSGRFALALVRWERLRARDGGHVMAWAGVACNLRELGRIDEAAEAVTAALRRFPRNAILLGEAARILATGKVGPLDPERLVVLAPEDGDDLPAYEAYADLVLASAGPEGGSAVIAAVGGAAGSGAGWRFAACLLALRCGRWREGVEAAEGLRLAGFNHPRLPGLVEDALHRMAARAEHGRWGDPAASLADYDFVLARKPDVAYWAVQRADALARLGRLADAERDLAVAEARFPGEDSALLARAGLLSRRGRHDEALAPIARYLARHPDSAEALGLRAAVLAEQAYDAGGAATAAMPILQAVGLEADEAKRDLLLRFESLGEDCEFGLVQRRYGAEPVGLFRWNSTRVASLVAALRARLQDVGAPEFTRMSTWAGIEYYLADTRWGFGFHTFRTQQEVGYDELYPKMCRRMVFLREKLLEDLADGRKTFVFKSDAATHDDLLALRDALNPEAPCRLLCVKQVARVPWLQGGQVVRLAERVYLGAVTCFGFREGAWDILYDEWLDICRGIDDAGPMPAAAALA